MSARNPDPIPPSWDGRLPSRSPMLAPLAALWREAPALARGWPGLPTLNALARGRGVTNGHGLPLAFVPPLARKERFEDGYEQRAWLAGEVETRPACRHDALNAFAWCLFPRTKAALNARHYAALAAARCAGAKPGANRDRARDALTLLDESGVVVACADPALAALLRGRQWKALFWERREAVVRSMRFVLLGHGLMEQALAPFVGLTGHGCILPVASATLEEPEGVLRSRLDESLAGVVLGADAAALRGALTPVPVLGVPGWSERAADPAFYDDASYFRPPRHAVA
jgi:hypothetical protein